MNCTIKFAVPDMNDPIPVLVSVPDGLHLVNIYNKKTNMWTQTCVLVEKAKVYQFGTDNEESIRDFLRSRLHVYICPLDVEKYLMRGSE